MPDTDKPPELYSVTIKIKCNTLNSRTRKFMQTFAFKSVLVFADTFGNAKLQAIKILRDEHDLYLFDYSFYVVAKVAGMSPEVYKARAYPCVQAQISTKGM